ncbi:hypothetical protein M3Y97_00329300 [Aphelenchoides bicaudatus]|nr:hypothetical protein M3Y97_00329300 [Aphelenchoides bicaudatus]
MTSNENKDNSADRPPVLNVVSTVRSAQSNPLKWQVNNFGLFLNSKAKALYQQFGPLHNVHFQLSLSKRQSPQNDDDKLELAIKSYSLNGQESTAQLKGRIWMTSEEGWNSNFALNFTDSTRHFFATPISSFNSASVLTIGDMIFEQIIVDTEVLGSWVMRLDDSCIMSRSVAKQESLEMVSNEEEEQENVLEDIEVVDSDLASYMSEINVDDDKKSVSSDLEVIHTSSVQTEIAEISSVEFEPSECLETSNTDAEFVEPSLIELPVETESAECLKTSNVDTEVSESQLTESSAKLYPPIEPEAPKIYTPLNKKAEFCKTKYMKLPAKLALVKTETNPVRYTLHKLDSEVGHLLKRLRAQPKLIKSYQKVYKHLDDGWLKSLDELLTHSSLGYDLETLKKEVVDLKRARQELYDKLRQHFKLFGSDFLLCNSPTDEEKQNLNEFYVLIDYFEAILKKLAKNQADLDENASHEDQFWLLGDFPDCSQENKWLEDYNKVRHTNKELFFLTHEIRAYVAQDNKLSNIEDQLNALWNEYVFVTNGVDANNPEWIKEAESKMEKMHIEISDCEVHCLKLFIRPADVETFGEIRCKLAQLESNISEMFKNNEDEKDSAEYDLDELYQNLIAIRKIINDGNGRLLLPILNEKIEFVKQQIKELDACSLQKRDQLRLDDLKDTYDELRSLISEVDKDYTKPSMNFYKAIKSINQVHSNFSYTKEMADSKSLMNYEVELCKCLAELEASIAPVSGDQLDGVQFWHEHYAMAKRKADWVAQSLHELLSPWKEFMDLYTNIEQSHHAVGELVSQVATKPDNGYHETCQDIDMLDTVNASFETTRKDIAYIRRLCVAGQMKSTGLASEANNRLQRIDQAHRLVENSLNSLIFRLKAKTVNPFYGRGSREHRRRHGGAYAYYQNH